MRYLLYCFSLLLLIVGCSRSESEDMYEIQDVIYLKNNDLYFSQSCYSIANINLKDGMVITSKEEYEELADSMWRDRADIDPSCDTASVLEINFNKYSLIGIYTGYGACDTINKKILLDKSTETITYHIDIKKYTGLCIRLLVMDYNLALIPKIPMNYIVDFSVNEN